MGQEFGHAFEDLLELALTQILPRLEKRDKRKYRLSEVRRLEGVGGNIDHLIESSVDGTNWLPYFLFMEKHSTSSKESEKSFRRHLEEYIQAKIASKEVFKLSKTSSIRVCNLIYGSKDGWKKTIVKESKRLIRPTLFLPDFDFYENLQAMVDQTIESSHKPYNREKIKNAIKKRIIGRRFFSDFVRLIETTLGEKHERHSKWLASEISRSKTVDAFDLESIPSTYARRGLTEFLILNEKQREEVYQHMACRERLGSKTGMTADDFRLMQLSTASCTVRISLNGTHLGVSPAIKSLPLGSNLKAKMADVSKLFFSPQNEYSMNSSEYLAYFDFQNSEFPKIIRAACQVIDELTSGRKKPMTDHLMKAPDAAARVLSCSDREVARCQNVYLESVMGVLSVAADNLIGTRTDLSTSVLARLSGVSSSVVNKARGNQIIDRGIALKLITGISKFIDSNGIRRSLKTFLDDEVASIDKWIAWKLKGTLTLPKSCSPTSTMSPVWARHNQLNSHTIFNPLTALVYLWLEKDNSKDVNFGFPVNRSSNPLELVRGKDFEGLDYEFSILKWNATHKKLRIFETSSVKDFKHSSDKCKELSAKIRMVRSALHGKCDLSAWLMLDGDWRNEHYKDLRRAGWDQIVYSRNFLIQTFGKE